MEFEHVVKERTAIRKFKSEMISDEDMTKVLKVGSLAPTAKNIQPQKIYVVKSKDGIEKIDLCSPCRYNAPVVLIVCGNKDIAFKKGDYSTYEMDACIVATHMMLEATNIGLGSIWIEMFDKEKIKQLFNISDNIEPVCLLPIGYIADDYQGNPMHNIRKDLNEIVEYL